MPTRIPGRNGRSGTNRKGTLRQTRSSSLSPSCCCPRASPERPFVPSVTLLYVCSLLIPPSTVLEVDASKSHIQYNHSNRNKLTVYEIQNCDCITSPEADSLLDCLRDCGFFFLLFPLLFPKCAFTSAKQLPRGVAGGLAGYPPRHRKPLLRDTVSSPPRLPAAGQLRTKGESV